MVPAGVLQYRNNGTSTQVIAELDLLLTGGRVNDTLKRYMASEFDSVYRGNPNNTVAALKYAQKMMLLSTEFHTTNANILTPTVRNVPLVPPSLNRPSKNVIVVFLNGGLDRFAESICLFLCLILESQSYNLLVPDPSCALYNEYVALRTGAALNSSQLLPITPPVGQQSCSTYAVHSAIPTLQSLFASGEASFLANIGPMIEPVSQRDFLGTSGVKKKFPPSLFAHNLQQLAIQNLDPSNLVAKGVLGRAITALQNVASPYNAAMYSITGKKIFFFYFLHLFEDFSPGTNKMVEGGQPLSFVSAGSGFPTYYNLAQMNNSFNNITRFVSGSVFGETFTSALQSAVSSTQFMAPLVRAVTLNTTFSNSGISAQFSQVAKLIKLQSTLKTERAVFLTSAGGYDTHNSFDMVPLLRPLDAGLASLVAELKLQGQWSNTVILATSDFGRTLTSNGQGTDHSWGGMVCFFVGHI